MYEGSLFTRVELKLSVVKHIITMFNGADLESKSLEIVNFVDILNESNYELAMKVTSDVKSGDEFYSDLNGFQVIAVV